MQDTFALSCENQFYQPSDCTNPPLFGTVLLGINSIQTDWTNTYIAIYINDEYSTNGIDNITLTEGDIYRFEHTLVEEAPQ